MDDNKANKEPKDKTDAEVISLTQEERIRKANEVQVCPHCGRCPLCGRGRDDGWEWPWPIQPQPYYPQPYTPPTYYYWSGGSNTTDVSPTITA